MEVIDRAPVYACPPWWDSAACSGAGGSVAELFDLINVPDSRWASACPRLACEHASTVATYAAARAACEQEAPNRRRRACWAVIDPHRAGLRIRPKDEETVMVATKRWVVAMTTYRRCPVAVDGLCCLSARASYTARTKYSDASETVMRAQRPVLLTSIGDIASRSDLLDRMIVLTLPTIPEAGDAPSKLSWRHSTSRTLASWARCSMLPRMRCGRCPM